MTKNEPRSGQIWDWYNDRGLFHSRHKLIKKCGDEWSTNCLLTNCLTDVRPCLLDLWDHDRICMSAYGTWKRIFPKCYCGQEREEYDYCCPACRKTLRGEGI